MRILSLFVLFTAAFYLFIPQEQDREEIDILKVKISAPEREPAVEEPRALVTEKKVKIKREPVEVAPVEEEVAEETRETYFVDDSQISEGTAEVEHHEEEAAQVSEFEAGWNHELREALTMIEPEYGEEIYGLYEAERGTFQADFDYLIKQHQKNPDLEIMLNDLEIRHEERLKEIFGRHYEEIKALQNSYIQYRTSSN